MKQRKRITAVLLSVALLGTTAAPAYAASAPGAKQEVVYVMTEASGAVRDMEVVNIFDGGEITDYGDYAQVKVLNTTDKIKQKGDQVRIDSSADKVYYQGTMKTKQMPWDISLRYFLDGKEYSASALAGKSGALEIRFSVSKNQNCTGDFYENYALQAAFTLDTEKCTGITADGATLANVGTDKQISYTVLPGKGLDAVIRAKVTDFEMDAVSINGIRLDLNVDIDDEVLKEKVSALVDATKQLSDGAGALYAGAGELQNGSFGLRAGAASLHSGNKDLDEGVATLQDGLYMVQDGLNSLNAQSAELVTGSSEVKKALKKMQSALNSLSAVEEDLTGLITNSGKIKDAISRLYTGATELQENLGYTQYKALMAQNGLDIDALKAGNEEAVKTIEKYAPILGENSTELQQLQALLKANNAALGGMESYLNGVSGEMPALTEGLASLNAQYETFDTVIGELVVGLGKMTGNLATLAEGINGLAEEYEQLDSGVGAYTTGVARLTAGYSQVMDGISSLARGSKALVSGSGELYDGTVELYDGVASLCGGAKEMADGTDKFYGETSKMREQAEEEIDSILDAIGGNREDATSFVSAKNTDVDSVQFVIKTATVEKKEPEQAKTVQPKKLNFWQKLLRLFGIGE